MSKIRLKPWNELFNMEKKKPEKQFVPLCLG